MSQHPHAPGNLHDEGNCQDCQMEDEEENMLGFLRQVACGAVSGRFSEWPQLKPALKWLLEKYDAIHRKGT